MSILRYVSGDHVVFSLRPLSHESVALAIRIADLVDASGTLTYFVADLCDPFSTLDLFRPEQSKAARQQVIFRLFTNQLQVGDLKLDYVKPAPGHARRMYEKTNKIVGTMSALPTDVVDSEVSTLSGSFDQRGGSVGLGAPMARYAAGPAGGALEGLAARVTALEAGGGSAVPGDLEARVTALEERFTESFGERLKLLTQNLSKRLGAVEKAVGVLG